MGLQALVPGVFTGGWGVVVFPAATEGMLEVRLAEAGMGVGVGREGDPLVAEGCPVVLSVARSLLSSVSPAATGDMD